MGKNIYKGIKKCVCLLVLFGLVFANNSTCFAKNADPGEVVSMFLDKLISRQYEDAYALVVDDRFAYCSEDSLNAFISLYSKDEILDYKLVKVSMDCVATKIKFSSGEEHLIPFYVEKGKVHISLDDVKDMVISSPILTTGYKSIAHPFYNPLETLVDSYSFSYLYGIIYGIDSFNLSSSEVRIRGTQYSDPASGPSTYASVEYAIVKSRWYGDDVWASSCVYNLSGDFVLNLSGNSSSASGVQVRIANLTEVYPRSAGSGSIYQVSDPLSR